MKFHFSGICGAGMGNVASLIKQAGHEVKGSDSAFFPPMSDVLKELDIKTLEGYDESHLRESYDPDYQIISNVLSKDHIEVKAGEKHNIPRLSFPQALNQFIIKDRDSIVIAGTHGKSTTTSIAAKLLESIEPGYFIGGALQDGSPGAVLGNKNSPFILEGDEYDTAFFDKNSKFLHYKPKYLILTYLEWDHIDIFPKFEDMLKQFRDLLSLIPEDGKVFYCGDCDKLNSLMASFHGSKVSYGFKAENDIVIRNVEKEGKISKVLCSHQNQKHSFKTYFKGDIYIQNCTVAWFLAKEFELSEEKAQKSLDDFKGVKRRLEVLHQKPLIYSDFAHHPTAIEATIKILKKEYPNKKIWAIFDPRNATSRRSTFEGRIAAALSHADCISIGPPAEDKRLNEDEKFSSLRVASSIGEKAIGFTEPNDLTQHLLNTFSNQYVIVIMSCGAFHGIFNKIEDFLNENQLAK